MIKTDQNDQNDQNDQKDQKDQKRPKTNNFVQCYSCWLFRGTCGGNKVGLYRSKTK